MVLPRGRPERATEAVLALQRASLACRSAVHTLDGGPSLAPGWGGVAANEYRSRRAVLSGRCAELDRLTADAAAAVARWSVTAVADRASMVRAKAAVDDVVAAETAAAGAGQLYRPDLTTAHDAALAAWAGARDDYQAEVTRLAQQLTALRDDVTDRSLGLGEQAQAFVQTVWDGAVAAPAEQVWSLTGQALTDPNGWWDTVTALPGQARELAGRVFHDPLGVLGDTVDAEAWRNGHVGEGLGAAAVLFMPGPKWLELGPETSASRVLAGMSRVTRALPRLRTVDELLDRVDLELNEHPERGHVLERHVDVTDDYLMDRLTHGTLAPDGTRGLIPREASRFTDRATAETAITEALRAREAELREFAANPTSNGLRIDMNLDRDIGVVFRREPGGGFKREDGQGVTVVLAATPQGQVYIQTAFVGVSQ